MHHMVLQCFRTFLLFPLLTSDWKVDFNHVVLSRIQCISNIIGLYIFFAWGNCWKKVVVGSFLKRTGSICSPWYQIAKPFENCTRISFATLIQRLLDMWWILLHALLLSIQLSPHLVTSPHENHFSEINKLQILKWLQNLHKHKVVF